MLVFVRATFSVVSQESYGAAPSGRYQLLPMVPGHIVEQRSRGRTYDSHWADSARSQFFGFDDVANEGRANVQRKFRV